MTKPPSRPEQKPASKTAAGDKAVESEVTGAEAMNRFKRLAKAVTDVSRADLEKAARKTNQMRDRSKR